MKLKIFLLIVSCGQLNQAEFNKNDVIFHIEYDSIKVLLSEIKDENLIIVSDDNIVWNPFLADISPDSLMEFYNLQINIDKDSNDILLYDGNSTFLISKVWKICESSEVSELDCLETLQYIIKEASIKDEEIILKRGIHIGMSKKSFFEALGIEYKSFINIVEIFDPPGTYIEQKYIFSNDRLSSITIISP